MGAVAGRKGDDGAKCAPPQKAAQGRRCYYHGHPAPHDGESHCPAGPRKVANWSLSLVLGDGQVGRTASGCGVRSSGSRN